VGVIFPSLVSPTSLPTKVNLPIERDKIHSSVVTFNLCCFPTNSVRSKQLGSFWKVLFPSVNSTNFAHFLEKLVQFSIPQSFFIKSLVISCLKVC
jgi:hypothetical protein